MFLEQIQYLDYPEILINEHERTEMPFRYVKGEDGQPIMPRVRITPDGSASSLENTANVIVMPVGNGRPDQKGRRPRDR